MTRGHAAEQRKATRRSRQDLRQLGRSLRRCLLNGPAAAAPGAIFFRVVPLPHACARHAPLCTALGTCVSVPGEMQGQPCSSHHDRRAVDNRILCQNQEGKNQPDADIPDWQ